MSYIIDQQKLQQFGSLEFKARQVVEGFITGLHKSPFHGFSVEFAEHQLYNAGESIKHIDWKLYGRTDRLYVKRFEEETNLRCQLVIDNSSSMYFPQREKLSIDNPNKITFSIYAAASIMQLLRRQRDAVGLSIFSDIVEKHTQARSSAVYHKVIISELEKMLQPLPVETRKNTRTADALHFIAENIHKRSLVVIFSDMFESGQADEIFPALQHLRHNKHEVILFHVVDVAKEIGFEFENRPYRFVDLETGEDVRVQPREIKAKYLEAIHAFDHELKLRCGQYRIDLIKADINSGFQQVLLPYLLKREKHH